MIDYCGNCAPKWYGPTGVVITAQQCNWVPDWSARLQTFSTAQGTLRCPPPPDCTLDFLNVDQGSQEQSTDQQSGENASTQSPQSQPQCHYENPQMAPNGCLMGCGTLSCDTTVRFLQITVGKGGAALATWVPPLGSSLGQTYTAELSYDGNAWRSLPLEQQWATFAKFHVDEGKKFQVRVTAGGYPSLVKSYDPAMDSKASATNSSNTDGTNQSDTGTMDSSNATSSSKGAMDATKGGTMDSMGSSKSSKTSTSSSKTSTTGASSTDSKTNNGNKPNNGQP